MPKLSDAEYASQNAKTLELAAQPKGTTINEIMEKVGEKGVSRPRATDLVNDLKLVVIATDGRTRFYGAPGSTPMAAAPTAAPSTEKSGEKKTQAPSDEISTLEKKVRRLSVELGHAIADLATAQVKANLNPTPATSETVETDIVQVEGETPAAGSPAPEAPAAEAATAAVEPAAAAS